jgi:hypothetical protein
MAFPLPSPVGLSPVEWSDQDAAFFDGVFSQQNQHDFSLDDKGNFIGEDKENLDPAVKTGAMTDDEAVATADRFVVKADLRDADIICVKGMRRVLHVIGALFAFDPIPCILLALPLS